MGEGSGNVTGVDVDGLHGTGRKIAGRSAGGSAAARNLKHGLDSASSTMGHHDVKSALSTFLTDQVVDDSNLLGVQLEAAGDNTSGVASTARASDEAAAHAVHTVVGDDTEIGDRINRRA